MATRNEEPETATALLLASAWWARWRAPELSVTLARHAERQTEDPATRAGLHAVVASASFRLGDSHTALPEALAAMHAVEAAGPIRSGAVAGHELAMALRVDIAGCAASVSLPRSAFAVLRPLFAGGRPVPPATRAAALVRLVRSLSGYGPRPELDEALRTADELYAAETDLHKETVAALRGLLRAVTAARHRRLGDAAAAVDTAGDGLGLLPAAGSLAADGLHARARLTRELTAALLDRGEREAAVRSASPLLDTPIRAQDGAAAGWLRLTLADRVHRQRGDLERAGRLLRDAAAIAARHHHDSLLAASQESLAELGELTGDLEESLECLRRARAARAASARSYEHARRVLGTEFPAPSPGGDLFALLREWSAAAHATGRAEEQAAAAPQHREPASAPATPEPAVAATPPEPAESEEAAAPSESRRRRHGTESSRYLAVSAVPGVVVAEGSGGRRRAPEPEDEDARQEPGTLAPPEPRTPSQGGGRFAAAESGRHGARDIGARIAAPRQRSSGRAGPRQARHAAADRDEPREDVPAPATTEPWHTAVEWDLAAPGEPETVPPSAPVTVEVPPPEPDRADLGLADLLAEALAAYRDGERPDAAPDTEWRYSQRSSG